MQSYIVAALPQGPDIVSLGLAQFINALMPDRQPMMSEWLNPLLCMHRCPNYVSSSHPLMWDQFVLGKPASVTILDCRGTWDKDLKTWYEDESPCGCCNVNFLKVMHTFRHG